MKNYTKEKRNYQHLNVEEREIIAIGLASNKSIAEIGKELGRHRSTLWREIRRNNAQKRLGVGKLKNWYKVDTIKSRQSKIKDSVKLIAI